MLRIGCNIKPSRGDILENIKIEYIIDSAPFKQGRYSPASHIPIVDRKDYFEEPVDSIVIMAPGYTDEIAAVIKKELRADLDIRAIRSDHLERV